VYWWFRRFVRLLLFTIHDVALMMDRERSGRTASPTAGVSFESITEDTKLDVKAVRRSCRLLARKGLAEFYRGLMTEDGEMAGSGDCISHAAEHVPGLRLCEARARWLGHRLRADLAVSLDPA
jgi:hypothetical protein